MILDLLCNSNYKRYNVNLAKALGIHNAVLVDYIIEKYNYALENNLTYEINSENYFNFDINKALNDLVIEEDLKQTLLSALTKIGIITVNKVENNILLLSININFILSIISDSDNKTINKVAKAAKIKTTSTTGGKLTARQAQANNLKSMIVCSNSELLQAYREWVDGVYANPKGFLSGKSITIFQKTIDDFAKGDLDLALAIIDIATVNGYRDATWAINLFNKDYAAKWRKEHSTEASIITNQRKIELSNEVF